MLTCKKRRKCVPMIQPINALTPRVVFRGPEVKNGKRSNGLSESQTALINAKKSFPKHFLLIINKEPICIDSLKF